MPNYSGYSYDELVNKKNEITYVMENMTGFDSLQNQINKLERELLDKSCMIEELLEAKRNGGKIKKPDLHKAALAKLPKLAIIYICLIATGALLYFMAGLMTAVSFIILTFLLTFGIVLMIVRRETAEQLSRYEALKGMNYKQLEKEKAVLKEEYTKVRKNYEDMVSLLEKLPSFIKETYYRYALSKGGRLASISNKHKYYMELGAFLCKFYPQCGLEASRWNNLVIKEVRIPN